MPVQLTAIIDHAGRESACGREMGNNEFFRVALVQFVEM